MECFITPLVFATIGTILVIGSAIISGFITSRLEIEIAILESENLDSNGKIFRLKESINNSSRSQSWSQIKLSILQVTNNSSGLKQVMMDHMQALLHMYSGSFQGRVTKTEEKKWSELIKSMYLNGDQTAQKELSNILNSLQSKAIENNNAMAEERDERIKIIESHKRKVRKLHDISITLQIFGLIMVLLKDVAS